MENGKEWNGKLKGVMCSAGTRKEKEWNGKFYIWLVENGDMETENYVQLTLN